MLPPATTRAGILAAGNWIVDRNKVIDVYPQQDALANILDESVGNGGSPFNILVALARLGVSYPLEGLGQIGDDDSAHWIRAQCARYGIGTRQLHTHPTAPTSYTDVMTVRDSGRRTFFHQRGANAFLTPQFFDFSDCHARIFHLGYLLLLDALDAPDPLFGTGAARVLAQATAAGCKTSIDLVSEESSRFVQIVLPALPHVDYCVLNEFELEKTTGIPTRPNGALDWAGIEGAAGKLLEAGVREWVVVHAPEGACALGRDGQKRRQGSVRVAPADIVSTVGAGDAFAAGVLHALHDDAGIEHALKMGACVAATCLAGRGTSDGIPTFSECLALGERAGFREIP